MMAFTSVVTAGISVAEALITAGILSTVRGTAGVLAGLQIGQPLAQLVHGAFAYLF